MKATFAKDSASNVHVELLIMMDGLSSSFALIFLFEHMAPENSAKCKKPLDFPCFKVHHELILIIKPSLINIFISTHQQDYDLTGGGTCAVNSTKQMP